MKHLSNLDLGKNQLVNAAIQNLAAAPTSPVKGQVYFNTTDNIYYVYNGTAWVDLGKQGTMTSISKITGATNPIVIAGTATDPTLDLATQAGVTNGTQYTKVTVSDRGIVTAGANLVAADIPTLTAAKISDFSTAVRTNRLDQMAAPTADVSMNGQLLTNVADPVSPQDAATKAYVDATKTGLDFKDSVKAATTANITLSATQTIDGIALTAGDRVLVKNQTDAKQNGIYVVASGSWSRAADCDNTPGVEVTGGMYVFVEQGSTQADSGWVLTNEGTVTLGTDSLTFTQFSGAGQLDAGAGLTKIGNQINAVGTTNRITVNADSIDIAATYVGQASITTLGTITTGTWNGTTIAPTVGGTGLTSYAAGDMLYASAANTLSKVAGNITAAKQFLSMTSGVPVWGALTDGDIPSALTGKTYNGLTVTTAANALTLTKGTAAISISGSVSVAGTISIPTGSDLTRAGAHTLTLTTTGNTDVTLPTSGTLLSTANMATLGYPKKYTANVGDGSATAITIAHGLNTEDITVTLRDASTKEIVFVDTTIVDANNVRLNFAAAPASGAYKVVVIG